ncbi:MAG TPA: hypothetical protein VF190_09385, partial [Rhodothermales bacterium]
MAFLVKPGDRAALRRVFQINTVIWGGSFNAIIPVYRRLPNRLKAYPLRNGNDFVAGYIDAFNPDFLVATEAHLAEGVHFPSHRIIPLTDILDPEEEEHVGHGLSVIHLYVHLYDREFKFQRRHPIQALLPKTSDTKLTLLSAAAYGEFPPDAALDYFRQAYVELFDPVVRDIRPEDYFSSLTPGILNPRRTALEGLEVRRRGGSDDPVLFYMDGTSTLDLIDFWNLRALGCKALPLPRQWAADLVDACADFVAEHYRASPWNRAIMKGTTVVPSRSVATEEAEEYARSIRVSDARALSYQHWYPRFW